MKTSKMSKVLAHAAAVGALFASFGASAQLMSSNIYTQPHYLNESYFSINGVFTDVYSGTAVKQPTGFGDVYVFCADFFNTTGSSSTIYVTPGLGAAFSPLQTAQMRALYSNALPQFIAAQTTYLTLNGGSYLYNAALTPQFQTMNAIGTAMQDVLWEIENETQPATGLNMAAGSFQLLQQQAPYSGPVADIYGRAVDWATKIQSGAWVDIGGIDYHYVDGMGSQNQQWVTAVPEPATWGLMLFGLGLLGAASRRRAKR